jgi:hypothetical protein
VHRAGGGSMTELMRQLGEAGHRGLGRRGRRCVTAVDGLLRQRQEGARGGQRTHDPIAVDGVPDPGGGLCRDCGPHPRSRGARLLAGHRFQGGQDACRQRTKRGILVCADPERDDGRWYRLHQPPTHGLPAWHPAIIGRGDWTLGAASSRRAPAPLCFFLALPGSLRSMRSGAWCSTLDDRPRWNRWPGQAGSSGHRSHHSPYLDNVGADHPGGAWPLADARELARRRVAPARANEPPWRYRGRHRRPFARRPAPANSDADRLSPPPGRRIALADRARRSTGRCGPGAPR